MRIAFTGVGLSSVLFDRLSGQGNVVGGYAIQKFSSLLLKGLSEIEGVDVFSLSSVPRVKKSKVFESFSYEQEGSINYVYMLWCRFSLVRYLFEFLGSFAYCYKLSLGAKPRMVILCDTLKLSSMLGALLSSKLTGSASVALMTDMPGIGTEDGRFIHRFKGRVILGLIKKFDGFIFVTEAFAEKLTIQRERYIVMECIADSAQVTSQGFNPCSSDKVTVYAGGLYRDYGLIELMNCFEKSEGRIGVLRIFGGGPLTNDVIEFSQRSKYIEYFGHVSNTVVTKELASASLLINPRFTHGEYTNYSFPIKNMEYMMSSTPVLTSRLAGIPKDHYPHLYFLDEITPECIYNSIDRIFAMSDLDRYNFGQKARMFITENKTEKVQAEKLFSFFNNFNC